MKPLALCAACALIVAVAATPAAAQGPGGGGPYEGLFGGGVADAAQSLVANVSIGAGYDDDVLAAARNDGSVADPAASRSSSYTAFRGATRYSYAGERSSFGAHVGTSAQFFNDSLGGHISAHAAGVGGSLRLARRTMFSANQRVSYQPFLSVLPFAGGVEPVPGDAPSAQPPAQPELATAEAAYISYGSSASLSQQLSRRASATLSYGYLKSDFTNDERLFSSQRGAARLSYGLTRGLSLRAGYAFTDVKYEIDPTTRSNLTGHAIDLGVDFNRALSLSRRTTLGFGTGSTLVQDGPARYYVVTGHARLNHHIRRSWSAALNYNRTVEYLEAFARPFLADSATASLSGLFHTRVSFNASAGAAFGAIGLTSATDYDTYTGQTSVNVAVARYAGLGVSYTYYHYILGQGGVVVGLAPGKFDRQSVAAYLNLWAPLVTRGRRPNAPR